MIIIQPPISLSDLIFLVYLPLRDFDLSPAALLTFHAPHVAPNIHNYATRWTVNPGRLYEYHFSQRTALMLPPPYRTNCTNYEMIGTTPARPGLLDENLCVLECVANVTYKECGSLCVDSSPFSIESQYKMGMKTKGTSYKCYKKVLKELNFLHHCKGVCRQPCRKVTYVIEQETRVWPLSNEEEKLKVILLYGLQEIKKITSEKIDDEFIKNQLLLVSIHPSKSESLIYSYYPSFQDIELFGYFGGYLGMWLGFSVLSISDTILTLLSRLFSRCHKKQVITDSSNSNYQKNVAKGSKLHKSISVITVTDFP
ncbi:degenerin deg-1-like [Tachypleus tridentatus]|uniref:degenerin deg-1-like n=1 Tax=Tachypleus tridentatus TaxID=6853 RepID=UPI003FD3493A